jgi:hypothetical protein
MARVFIPRHVHGLFINGGGGYSLDAAGEGQLNSPQDIINHSGTRSGSRPAINTLCVIQLRNWKEKDFFRSIALSKGAPDLLNIGLLYYAYV